MPCASRPGKPFAVYTDSRSIVAPFLDFVRLAEFVLSRMIFRGAAYFFAERFHGRHRKVSVGYTKQASPFFLILFLPGGLRTTPVMEVKNVLFV